MSLVLLCRNMNLETKNNDWYIKSHSVWKEIGPYPRETFEVPLKPDLPSPYDAEHNPKMVRIPFFFLMNYSTKYVGISQKQLANLACP